MRLHGSTEINALENLFIIPDGFSHWDQKKNLVSGNADDPKKSSLGRRRFIFKLI